MNSKPSSTPSGSSPNSRSAPKLEHHIQVRLSAEEAAGTEGHLSSWFGPARTTRTMATIQCRARLTAAGVSDSPGPGGGTEKRLRAPWKTAAARDAPSGVLIDRFERARPKLCHSARIEA
jgi:hypothetical protein